MRTASWRRIHQNCRRSQTWYRTLRASHMPLWILGRFCWGSRSVVQNQCWSFRAPSPDQRFCLPLSVTRQFSRQERTPSIIEIGLQASRRHHIDTLEGGEVPCMGCYGRWYLCAHVPIRHVRQSRLRCWPPRLKKTNQVRWSPPQFLLLSNRGRNDGPNRRWRGRVTNVNRTLHNWEHRWPKRKFVFVSTPLNHYPERKRGRLQRHFYNPCYRCHLRRSHSRFSLYIPIYV